jgi:putative hydrolase of the HAD superfamily
MGEDMPSDDRSDTSAVAIAGPRRGRSATGARGFERTHTWIFDLDNTLYPSECRLFVQVEHRMGEFIAHLLGVPYEHAQQLRRTYYRQFGTTLTGLMTVHRIDPAPFLEYVHDIDLSAVQPSPRLRAAVERLEGRRLIFTNGSRRHAERVAEKVGVLDLIEDICGIEACEYLPKPDPEAFNRMIRAHGVSAGEAAMFEDMPDNLEAPHLLGMTTVLVSSTHPEHPRQREIVEASVLPDHIHHLTDDLADFLDSAVPRRTG